MMVDGAGSAVPVQRDRCEPLIPDRQVRASANICQAAGCLSMASDELFEAVREAVLARGLDDVAVRRVGCLGLCAAGPSWRSPSNGGSSSMSGPASRR